MGGSYDVATGPCGWKGRSRLVLYNGHANKCTFFFTACCDIFKGSQNPARSVSRRRTFVGWYQLHLNHTEYKLQMCKQTGTPATVSIKVGSSVEHTV